MSQSYKGLTIPSYADAADGPGAFSAFTDSGPIPRFADATARDAAIATPTNGQMCFLTGSNALQVRTGGAWVTVYVSGNLDLNGNRILNVGNPTADTDGFSWGYAKDTLVEAVYFSEPGTLSAKTGNFRWYAPWNCTIVDVVAQLGTAPTGASVIFDVNRNGGTNTIFATQGNRPTVAIGTNVAVSGAPEGTLTMTKDVSYLTVDIDQVGSGTAGSDAVVTVRVKRT